MLTRLTEGAITESAWRIDAPGVTTLQLMQPLRDKIDAEGFRILFECETVSCGGFDFRYSTQVLPEPDMHVDLGDFRFVAAQRGEGEIAEHLTLLVSRSREEGFVQLIRVEPVGVRVTASAKSPTAVDSVDVVPGGSAAPVSGDFAQALESGALALDDLVFDTGAAMLGQGVFKSLTALAEYLAAHPDRSVALVGHTDASGGLPGNIALSQRRAESVRDRLIRDLGVQPAQVVAQGVGYLSPRDSNLTLEGRTRNRRVEVILTSTQ
ncbi:MAG: OmpA family protein [Gemmobacter sp.]|nr:OmpA family protein [Gemmobacter sp.]